MEGQDLGGPGWWAKAEVFNFGYMGALSLSPKLLATI